MNHTREAISATTPMAPKLAPWAAGEASLQKNRTLAAFFPKKPPPPVSPRSYLTPRGCHTAAVEARPVKGGVLSVSQNNDSVILTCSVILSVSLF